jgi:hypothetical protein
MWNTNRLTPASFFGFLLLCLVLAGCATSRPAPRQERFAQGKDTFAFANELVWEYGYDANGAWSSWAREPQPEYTLRCFVLARSALQFYQSARFVPDEAKADQESYRRLVKRVVKTNPRKPLPESKKVLIPGFPDLHSFSLAHEDLLKDECGGAWQSYFQRGHWRMIFPFSRGHREQTAVGLLAAVAEKTPAVVHVLHFPKLTINHALVVYDASVSPGEIAFKVYDPNQPEVPAELYYDRVKQKFVLPRNHYFYGGPVSVYRVYHKCLY